MFGAIFKSKSTGSSANLKYNLRLMCTKGQLYLPSQTSDNYSRLRTQRSTSQVSHQISQLLLSHPKVKVIQVWVKTCHEAFPYMEMVTLQCALLLLCELLLRYCVWHWERDNSIFTLFWCGTLVTPCLCWRMTDSRHTPLLYLAVGDNNYNHYIMVHTTRPTLW